MECCQHPVYPTEAESRLILIRSGFNNGKADLAAYLRLQAVLERWAQTILMEIQLSLHPRFLLKVYKPRKEAVSITKNPLIFLKTYM